MEANKGAAVIWWRRLGAHLPAKRLQDGSRIALGVLILSTLGESSDGRHCMSCSAA